MLDNQKQKETAFIKFLGGSNLLFSLVALVLLSILIYLLNTISFVFQPFSILLASIISPLLLSIIFYYLFIPLVDWLETKKIPRTAGAGLSLILLFAFVIIGVGFAIPVFVSQINNFIVALPGFIDTFSQQLKQYTTNPELRTYYEQIIKWANSSLLSLVNHFGATLGTTFQGISAILSTVSTILFTLLTFPVFLFFLLIDGHQFKTILLNIFPKSVRGEINDLTDSINVQVGAYIKGRLIVSFLIGVYYFIIYSLIGMPYTFVLAILSALLSLIPYLGSIIILIPTVIIASTTSLLMLIEVIVIWAFAQILDGNILGPMIIGKNLSMHPLTIIIVLIGSGSIMGIVGMIIGIPLYAIIRIFVIYLFNRYKARYMRFFSKDNEY